MISKTIVARSLLRGSSAPLALGLALVAAPAIAQDAAAEEGAGEAIVVTGSRIARPDLTSTSPLAVVSDEEFKLSGAVNVEQVINTLPQVVPGSTAFSNNPGDGVATLDLRGLGETRTMVLVNGRRYMFYDSNQITDLNTIPQFLIDGVDVVTGGASAVYGSDAVAGVVNFRLKNDLEGLIAGGQMNISEQGDGQRANAYMALGSGFADGRGHITLFGEYYKRKGVFQGARDYTDCALTDGDGELFCGGSSTVPQGRVRYYGGANSNGTGVNGYNSTGVFFEQAGTSRAATSTDLYNYAPANYLMVPQERYLLGGYGEYEISDNLTLFGEAIFVNNRVDTELAATPVTGIFSVNVAQACSYLSTADCASLQSIDASETSANAAGSLTDDPGSVDLYLQRRITETGSRRNLDERNSFRTLIGLKGGVTDNIDFEAYYSYARTRNSNIQYGNISRSAFQAGLDGTGTAINIWGSDTLTDEMLDAITITAQNSEISELQVASAAITGSLFNLGLGASDVGFALGTEYRKMSAEFIPDTALSSGDVIGFNAGKPTAGSYDVKEIFAELNVPIIENGVVHLLELNGAGRFSDYGLDNVGGVWTYAAGVKFAPIKDITFRGQYQRAVRAPNVEELFGGQSVGYAVAADPCAQADAATDATINALCIATGVPAASVGTAGLQLNEQIEGIYGGNPDLQEEKSDTLTFGVVLQPSFIPRLNIAVDYYDITVKDAISVLGGSVGNVLNLCYNVIQDASSAYCQAITRNSAGVIAGDSYVVSVQNANIGKIQTRGIDLSVDYTVPLNVSITGSGDSRLNLAFLGTYLDKYDITAVQDLPDDVNECAGKFGTLACGEPKSKWKWSTRATWADGPSTISFQWRHLGSVSDDDPDVDYVVEKIKAYDIFNLAFGYDINDNLTLNAGVNNLFNKKPQAVGDNQEQSNTYPSTYDVLGRDFFVSARLSF